MAKRPRTHKSGMGRIHRISMPKRTRQGQSINTRYGNKGGGTNGTTPSKLYKKKSRGQGKR